MQGLSARSALWIGTRAGAHASEEHARRYCAKAGPAAARCPRPVTSPTEQPPCRNASGIVRLCVGLEFATRASLGDGSRQLRPCRCPCRLHCFPNRRGRWLSLTPAPVSPRRLPTPQTRLSDLGLSARLPPAWSRQLPISSFEEWHSVASGVEAVDLDLIAADHQVRVDVGAVDAHAP